MFLIEKNTTRAKIFDLLLKRGSLKAHQIFKEIAPKKDITFQAIHKLLREMFAEKSIKKDAKKHYSINPVFVLNLKRELRSIEKQVR